MYLESRWNGGSVSFILQYHYFYEYGRAVTSSSYVKKMKDTNEYSIILKMGDLVGVSISMDKWLERN